MIELILGGSGSGKSAFAEARVLELGPGPRYYIATMQVYGEEGQNKVQKHHALRKDKGFETLERYWDIDGALADMDRPAEARVLLECMSNLVANEMFRDDRIIPSSELVPKLERDICRLADQVGRLIIVSNNVFEDGISYEATTLDYMEALGRLNCLLAARADRVTELVCGIPLSIKNKEVEA